MSIRFACQTSRASKAAHRVRVWARIALLHVLLLCSLAPAMAQQCNLPPVTLKGPEAAETLVALKGLVLELTTGKVQDIYADRIVSSLSRGGTKGARTVRFSLPQRLVNTANQWGHVLKALTVTKALAAGELEPVRSFVIDESIEAGVTHFVNTMSTASSVPLTQQGVSLATDAAGHLLMVKVLLTAITTVKESYDALEHEDCLLNIDLAYYNFLEDRRLRWEQPGKTRPGAVDTYIREYLAGGGNDPGGHPRALNRRYLQCFINKVMPPDERIAVSQLGPNTTADPSVSNPPDSGWFARVFGTVSDTLGLPSADVDKARRLRTPVNVMLREFNHRYDVELQAREMRRLMHTNEYRQLVMIAEAMRATSKAADWLCARLKTLGRPGADPVCGQLQRRMTSLGTEAQRLTLQMQSIGNSGRKIPEKQIRNMHKRLMAIPAQLKDDQAEFRRRRCGNADASASAADPCEQKLEQMKALEREAMAQQARFMQCKNNAACMSKAQKALVNAATEAQRLSASYRNSCAK